MTVGEFFRLHAPARPPVDVALEHDVKDLFARRRKGRIPAGEFVRKHRAHLINRIEYWTGVPRPVVRALIDRIVEAADATGVTVIPGCEPVTLIELTTYATTLTMNYLTHGRFIPRSRRRPNRGGAATKVA